MSLGKTIQERMARVNCDSLLSFNGVDQYADAGPNTNVVNAINYNRDFCISAFVTLKSAAKSNLILVDRVDVAGDNTGFLFRTTPGVSPKLAFNLDYNASGNTGVVGNLTLSLNTLYHVAVVVGADRTVKLYINGVLDASGTLNSGTLTYGSNNIYFGHAPEYTGNNDFSSIAISHIAVFNRTLTEPEIRSIHRYGGYLATDEVRQACVAHYVADSVRSAYVELTPAVVSDTFVFGSLISAPFHLDFVSNALVGNSTFYFGFCRTPSQDFDSGIWIYWKYDAEVGTIEPYFRNQGTEFRPEGYVSSGLRSDTPRIEVLNVEGDVNFYTDAGTTLVASHAGYFEDSDAYPFVMIATPDESVTVAQIHRGQSGDHQYANPGH